MALTGGFDQGLVLGILIGYVGGPVVRAVWARMTWSEASREIELRRAEAEHWPPEGLADVFDPYPNRDRLSSDGADRHAQP
ncbi:MAG: hypothetical protein ACRDJ4_06030 [Actinomycetota bacterium]